MSGRRVKELAGPITEEDEEVIDPIILKALQEISGHSAAAAAAAAVEGSDATIHQQPQPPRTSTLAKHRGPDVDVDAQAGEWNRSLQAKEGNTTHSAAATELEQSIPGAYAVNSLADGEGLLEHTTDTDVEMGGDTNDANLSTASDGTENNADAQNTHIVAVAYPIVDADATRDLPRAQEAEPAGTEQRYEKDRRALVSVGCLALLLILLGVALVVGFSLRDTDGTTSTDGGDSMGWEGDVDGDGPVVKDKDIWDKYIMELLPEESVRAMRLPDSPQSQARSWILGDPSLPLHADWSIQQRFALATLYYSTGGPKWTNTTNYLSYEHHECQWYSRESFATEKENSLIYDEYAVPYAVIRYPAKTNPCSMSVDDNDSDKQGVYNHLWLDQNNLEGTLPAELSLLTSLKSMSFQLNPLHGSIPTILGLLTKMEAIAMSNNGLEGTLPTEIGLLTDLSIVSLWRNKLQGSIPSELYALTRMEVLSMRGNFMTGTLATVRHAYYSILIVIEWRRQGCLKYTS